METRANHFVVGVFVLTLIAAFMAALLWYDDGREDENFAFYDILFEGDVTGLQEQGPIRYRGVSVGRVESIGLDPDQLDRVRVTIRVRRDVPLRRNVEASLESQGLTGLAYVLLKGGTPDVPYLPRDTVPPFPEIYAQAGRIQAVLQGVPGLVMEAQQVAENLRVITDGVREALPGFLNQDNADQTKALISSVRTITQNIETLTTALAEMEAGRGFADLLTSTDNAMDKLTEAGQSITMLANDLRGTIQNLESATTTLVDMIKENREGIRRFTGGGLDAVNRLVEEMQETVLALRRVAEKMERDPARFFLGDQQRGYQPR